MITLNVIGDSIVGSVGQENFGLPYDAKLFNKLSKLQDKINKVDTMEEYKKLEDKFKSLLVVDYDSVAESECPDVYFNASKGTYHLKVGAKISKVAMPQELVDRLIQTLDKKLDPTPLIKFWIRWLRNPVLASKYKMGKGEEFSNRMFSYINAPFVNYELRDKLMIEHGVSEEVATERSTVHQVDITVEGLLKTYKVSREIDHKYVLEDGKKKKVPRRGAQSIDEDTGLITYENLSNEDRLFEPAVQRQSGDAFYCGDKLGHHIKVGKRHYLPDWSYVNTDDTRSCVKGLHCGGLGYINGYQYSDTETHNVLVDPMNVGAVPSGGDGAIRVLEYYVLDAFGGVNKGIYHSSKYAAESDLAWEEQKKEVIKNYGELVDDIREDAYSIHDL
jgi:hypothetical protein